MQGTSVFTECVCLKMEERHSNQRIHNCKKLTGAVYYMHEYTLEYNVSIEHVNELKVCPSACCYLNDHL